MTDKLFADIQYGGLRGRTPISVGIISSVSGALLYVEATDADIGPPEVLTKFQKTVGTHFVPTDEIQEAVVDWLARLSRPCSIACSTLQVCQTLEIWLMGHTQMNLGCANVETSVASEFFRVCGGAERARGHALLEAIALAAADMNKGLQLAVDTTQFGLLIGPKNSLSTRVFLRSIVQKNESLSKI